MNYAQTHPTHEGCGGVVVSALAFHAAGTGSRTGGSSEQGAIWLSRNTFQKGKIWRRHITLAACASISSEII